LQVDGGMTANDGLMHLQADILGIPCVRPSMSETTALGAAMAAGQAEGIEVWDIFNEDSTNIICDRFDPSIEQSERDDRYYRWKEAIKRSHGWEVNPEQKKSTAVPQNGTLNPSKSKMSHPTGTTNGNGITNGNGVSHLEISH